MVECEKGVDIGCSPPGLPKDSAHFTGSAPECHLCLELAWHKLILS